MYFTRTFHPVGQGAFYTEIHRAGRHEWSMVYDCGSLTRKGEEQGKRLQTEIETTFYKNQQIDVLFISHFHEDHINGIEFLKRHCKIKRVVMPYINDEARLILKTFARANNMFSITQLIDNPQHFFERIPVITIQETHPDKLENGAMDNPPEILSEIETSQERNSGTRFILDSKIEDWYYIPYNFKDNTRRAEFEKALATVGLKLSDISIANVCEKRNKMREVYAEVSGKNLNENSMVLFSGKRDNDTVICCGNCLPKKMENSGCLYTGDVNLKLPGLVDALRKKLNGFYNHIGTLQIPHHGSENDYDSSILEGSAIKCAAVSYGINNTYGHPADGVIKDLASKGIDVHHITEYSHISQYVPVYPPIPVMYPYHFIF